MLRTAVAAARAVQYDNAGTVEFLLDPDGNFYFLEMNTRLQVEHPVTEMVTGLDLVAWQIGVAVGEPLPLVQDAVSLSGHAIKARLYAENPANNFLPVTGPVLLWRAPAGEGVRVDDGIQTGDEVSVHYDPMLAKIIAHGPDRQTAVQRLVRALETAVLLVFTHNLPYLQDIVQQPDFAAGQDSTHFLAEQLADWPPPAGDVPLALIGAVLAQFYRWLQHPYRSGHWRNNPNGPIRSQHPAIGQRRYGCRPLARAGCRGSPGELGARFGLVSFQLIGVKNISASSALAKWRRLVNQGKRQE